MWMGWLKLLVYLGVTEFGLLESNMLIGKCLYIFFLLLQTEKPKNT